MKLTLDQELYTAIMDKSDYELYWAPGATHKDFPVAVLYHRTGQPYDKAFALLNIGQYLGYQTQEWLWELFKDARYLKNSFKCAIRLSNLRINLKEFPQIPVYWALEK